MDANRGRAGQRADGRRVVSAVSSVVSGMGGDAALARRLVVAHGQTRGMERFRNRVFSGCGELPDPVQLARHGFLARRGAVAALFGDLLGHLRGICGEIWESVGTGPEI